MINVRNLIEKLTELKADLKNLGASESNVEYLLSCHINNIISNDRK